jgi:general secretion pathway protein A
MGNHVFFGKPFSTIHVAALMYRKFYGISANPFQMNPDPRFLYMTPTHEGAMSSMIVGIRERKGITVVTGEVGTGKTTLVHALLNGLSGNFRTAFVFHSSVLFQDLLRNILLELGEKIRDNDLTSMINQFHRHMMERMAKDETVVIAIDEGQNLNIDVIEKLFRIFIQEAPAAKLIQILLIGQPELENKLDTIKLQDFKRLVTTRFRIDTLDEKECGEYIEHRLEVAGSAGACIFKPEAVRLIWKYSQGIPRVINTLCDCALRNGFTASQKTIDRKIAKDAIREMGYLRPKVDMFFRKPAFLYALSGVFIAAALWLGVLTVLRPDRGVPPAAATEAVVAKADQVRIKIHKQEQPLTVEQEKIVIVKQDIE